MKKEEVTPQRRNPSRVCDIEEMQAEAERQTEVTTGQKSPEVGKQEFTPPFHPTLSMCNLTCSADWLPAVADPPEALVWV